VLSSGERSGEREALRAGRRWATSASTSAPRAASTAWSAGARLPLSCLCMQNEMRELEQRSKFVRRVLGIPRVSLSFALSRAPPLSLSSFSPLVSLELSISNRRLFPHHDRRRFFVACFAIYGHHRSDRPARPSAVNPPAPTLNHARPVHTSPQLCSATLPQPAFLRRYLAYIAVPDNGDLRGSRHHELVRPIQQCLVSLASEV
jgi:hypothetical protein